MSEPKSEVVFKNPPPPVHGRYDWATIAKKVRKKPEEWALVFEDDNVSLATAIRAGNVTPLLPSKGFIVRTANGSKGPPRKCDMYLMYVPENDRDRKG